MGMAAGVVINCPQCVFTARSRRPQVARLRMAAHIRDKHGAT